MQGVYKIEITPRHKYWGSTSKTFDRRRGEHLYFLRRNEHNNRRLQSAFNKYGEEAFTFEPVEEVVDGNVRDVEQLYLNEHHGQSYCCNVAKDAKAPSLGMKIEWTDEQRTYHKAVMQKTWATESHRKNHKAAIAARQERHDWVEVTASSRKLAKKATQKTVVIIDPQGNKKKYECVKDAAEAIGDNFSTLKHRLRGAFAWPGEKRAATKGKEHLVGFRGYYEEAE